MKIIQLHKNHTALIAAAAKNSRQAQHELYQLYAPKMLSVCRMYIKDLQFAEEAMLNGFFKVFTHIKEYRNQGSFEGWIRKIMVRESISFLRKKSKIIFQDSTLEEVQDQPQFMHTKIDVEYLQNAIDTLPEGYKIIFIMYAVEGYKHHEIAKLLNIKEGTSKSQLHKARKMLQEKLMQKNTGYGIK
ncbi:MAG: RNA polymerase subunit sigma-70 [Flavobacteriaceae bacterium CG_4_8_14_3_um_filter_34_10]|nr:MAG: RNA polymerase subunit sigma-70 [Flavobacteriaceae bacterium CG2_30_34_30]PIX09101.1 MAG: RNA polymerase subunit sigma-70 [Flavobacteriaceae bacterium CG_4_8_14_3_um_filter_34_10]